MEVTKESIAGTLESSDAMIRITPCDKLTIVVNSSVKEQFGDDILKSVKDTLSKLGIERAQIVVNDKGALDCVIQARLKSAIQRAINENIKWSDLI